MKLRIDHITVELSAMEDEMVIDGVAVRGYFDPNQETIQIARDQSPANQADTLLHEIIHAIWSVRSLPARLSEEQVALWLASGLASVFKANPELLVVLSLALNNDLPVVGKGG